MKDPHFHLANTCPQYGVTDAIQPPPHPDVMPNAPNSRQPRRFQRFQGRGRGHGRGNNQVQQANHSDMDNSISNPSNKRARNDDNSSSTYGPKTQHRRIEQDATSNSFSRSANDQPTSSRRVHFQGDR